MNLGLYLNNPNHIEVQSLSYNDACFMNNLKVSWGSSVSDWASSISDSDWGSSVGNSDWGSSDGKSGSWGSAQTAIKQLETCIMNEYRLK
jgi:hypothetical protein